MRTAETNCFMETWENSILKETLIQEHQGDCIGQYQDYQLIACESCGYTHVDPLPSSDFLKTVYDEQFYSEDKPEYLEKDAKEQPYWRESVYKYRYDKLEELLPDVLTPRRILDVGCSGGFFLRYGEDRGWDVLGIEPALQAASYARDISGIEVIHDYFQNLDIAQLKGKFQAVHLRQVLEHLPNPLELCQKAYDVLEVGGILCIEVPNDFNLFQKMLHEHFDFPEYWVSIPHHLNYFSFDSLRKLLEKTGFQSVYEEASFPMEFFLLMGDRYIEDNDVGRACHSKRMQFEQALNVSPEARQFREAFYTFLASQGVGRTLTIFARKQ